MFLSTIKRQLTTWIAIFAILGGALFPALAIAMKDDQSNQIVMELCSTGGTGQMVMIDLDHGESKAKMEHCPFCLIHAPYVPLTQTNLSFEKPQIPEFFPSLFYQSPKPLYAWRTLPSRAPPFNI